MKRNIALIFALFLMNGPVYSQSNDHIFPAAPSAKKYIDFDGQGFLINGKKTFLVSAGLEYARIPRQLWEDRLLRLKRAGFNCIEIYTFWNFHEPHEGRFDFSGDHDLDAFLKLVKQMDMYAIVRVGPYYCAEWDLGGYPVWLRFKGDFPVREPDSGFEKYVDRFFDTLIPIVSNNQVSRGGAVVLVQVENEHSAGWGTFMPNAYFTHLREKVLSLGIRVPYFFSGLHHGSDPAGDGIRAFDDPSRPNPWFTTEFWTVWYNYYGSSRQDADKFGRRTWKIIAHGGGGYNYYMAHGGTNFGYTNNDEDAASYDYGAAVGQTGDLRPIYYQFKRNALFARSFESILCNGTDASPAYQGMVSDTSVRVYARHSGNGDIIFLDNYGSREVPVTLGGASIPGEITLAPGEIMPIVKDFPLTAQVTMDWAVSRVLGVSKQDSTTTLVVYGPAGSNGGLQFSADQPIYPASGKEAFRVSSKGVILRLTFKEDEPVVYSFKSGSQLVRIITLSPAMADRTWFAGYQGRQYVITGPEYLGRITGANGHIHLATEHFWEQAKRFPVYIFSGARSQTVTANAPAANHTEELALGAWQARDASAAAAPGFDDSQWFKSNTAAQMGADNDLSCYAWYRTHIHLDSAGDYVLKIKSGGDRAMVFVDNVRAASGKVPGDIVLRRLTAGSHTLAVFTSHTGRNKLYNYYGPIDRKDAKGLSEDVVLQKNKTASDRKEDTSGEEALGATQPGTSAGTLTGWRMKGGPGDDAAATGWKPLGVNDAFDRPHFYKSHFNVPSVNSDHHAMWRVTFEGLGHGSIWVNGHNLGRYPEKVPVKSLYIPECWLVKGDNNIVIYDEDGNRPDKISIRAETAASRDVLYADGLL
jgi:beta-galactosidase